MPNAIQLGPFGHQLRAIALASGLESDIRRWNAYAIAQSAKLDRERATRNRSGSGAEWFYSQGGFHAPC